MHWFCPILKWTLELVSGEYRKDQETRHQCMVEAWFLTSFDAELSMFVDGALPQIHQVGNFALPGSRFPEVK